MNLTKAKTKFGRVLPDLKPPLCDLAIPLRGSSMVLIEPNIIFSALDNFFGGFGRGIGTLPPDVYSLH